jgi:hypothetical protein
MSWPVRAVDDEEAMAIDAAPLAAEYFCRVRRTDGKPGGTRPTYVLFAVYVGRVPPSIFVM